jgi:hypothetical protein
VPSTPANLGNETRRIYVWDATSLRKLAFLESFLGKLRQKHLENNSLVVRILKPQLGHTKRMAEPLGFSDNVLEHSGHLKADLTGSFMLSPNYNIVYRLKNHE